jgi:tetratricopeptide (TPR) repeat protein
MAAHCAQQCAGSAAAFIGDDQRQWLIAVDREQDNIRGALEWAVANDDAETALTIAGGASWPHWLAGTSVEGKRWLDDAFRCTGEASESARALALTGRGLIAFQLGAPAGVDADLEAALAFFRANDDVASMALTYSFYAEVAAARGDIEEGRRRRREVLAFYLGLPDADPFVLGARAYSLAKLAVLDGDLTQAEDCYRQAADGFSKVGRPMMRSMCLGMIADFAERTGDSAAAVAHLDEAIEINDSLGLRGFSGALLARLGWALLQCGDPARAESVCRRSLEIGRRLNHTPALFTAQTALSVVHRLHGRSDAAAAAATEALELAMAGGPRRLSNRIDVQADALGGTAACCVVLGGLAADAGAGERAALLLGRADRLRDEAGVAVPRLQVDDLARTRRAAVALIGEDAFLAAFEAGQQGRLGHEVPIRP